MRLFVRRSTIPTEGENVIAKPKQHSNKSEKNKKRRIRIYLTPQERESELEGGVRFNKHHRRPRCQGGQSSDGNVVIVDQKSHEHYNQLVSLVAEMFGIKQSKVKTWHIARYVNKNLPVFERLFTNPSTGVLKGIKEIVDDFNPTWLPKDDQFRLSIDEGVPTGKLRDFK